jgi:hypothetical protein
MIDVEGAGVEVATEVEGVVTDVEVVMAGTEQEAARLQLLYDPLASGWLLVGRAYTCAPVCRSSGCDCDARMSAFSHHQRYTVFVFHDAVASLGLRLLRTSKPCRHHGSVISHHLHGSASPLLL